MAFEVRLPFYQGPYDLLVYELHHYDISLPADQLLALGQTLSLASLDTYDALWSFTALLCRRTAEKLPQLEETDDEVAVSIHGSASFLFPERRMRQMERRGLSQYARRPLFKLTPPRGSSHQLLMALEKMFKRRKMHAFKPRTLLSKPWPIQETIDALIQRLQTEEKIVLWHESSKPQEILLSLFAGLEISRTTQAFLVQKTPFGEVELCLKPAE